MKFCQWHILVAITSTILCNATFATGMTVQEQAISKPVQTHSIKQDKIIVQIPWKVEGTLPHGQATISCYFFNEQCVPMGGGSSITFPVTTNSSGMKSLEFSESDLIALQATEVLCCFTSKDFGGSDIEYKSILGGAARCSKKYDTPTRAEKYSAKVVAERQKRREDAAKKDAAEQKAHQDFKNKQAAAKNNSETSKTNKKNTTAKLIKGKTKAEWEAIWKRNRDESEAAAERGTNGGKRNMAGSIQRPLPDYCETDEHCTFGHYFWMGLLYDTEHDAVCVNHECVMDAQTGGAAGVDLNPRGSTCKSDKGCQNVKYAGSCNKGTCSSIKRRKCEVPGDWISCNSRDGKREGKALCTKHKRLANCQFK